MSICRRNDMQVSWSYIQRGEELRNSGPSDKQMGKQIEKILQPYK